MRAVMNPVDQFPLHRLTRAVVDHGGELALDGLAGACTHFLRHAALLYHLRAELRHGFALRDLLALRGGERQRTSLACRRLALNIRFLWFRFLQDCFPLRAAQNHAVTIQRGQGNHFCGLFNYFALDAAFDGFACRSTRWNNELSRTM